MTDFWFDIFLAAIIGVATTVADRIAFSLISSTRKLAAIKRVVEQAAADSDKIRKIDNEVKKYYLSKETAAAWGSELALIAFALDLSILGVWIRNSSFFPFFTRWNAPNTSREIPVWFILIFTHFILLLISISLKHFHNEYWESIDLSARVSLLKPGWLKQNWALLSGSVVGFISLLTSILIITNAI